LQNAEDFEIKEGLPKNTPTGVFLGVVAKSRLAIATN